MIPSRRRIVLLAMAAGSTQVARLTAQDYTYWPPPSGTAPWAPPPAGRLGFDPGRLDSAIAFARASEIAFPQNPGDFLLRNAATDSFAALLGPVRARGATNGMLLHHGYLVAAWGDTERADMVFSVSKSVLSLTAGVAAARGLLTDLDEPVARTVRDPAFEGPRNREVTWRHLLTQTSEWEGTLWEKPDRADRRAGRDRSLRPPGTFWEYNDVRVNVLAYALLHRFREPLPLVLRREVLDPIGASASWEWHGYRNSFVTLDGRQVQSVSGGGHWGGGVFAATSDLARLGLLMARRGTWNGRRIVSEEWVRTSETPIPQQEGYGFLWWLNTGTPPRYPAAPPSSVFALGGGGHVIWIDPDHDVVLVLRWFDPARTNAMIGRVLEALR